MLMGISGATALAATSVDAAKFSRTDSSRIGTDTPNVAAPFVL